MAIPADILRQQLETIRQELIAAGQDTSVIDAQLQALDGENEPPTLDSDSPNFTEDDERVLTTYYGTKYEELIANQKPTI